jgi:hypothetical protein
MKAFLFEKRVKKRTIMVYGSLLQWFSGGARLLQRMSGQKSVGDKTGRKLKRKEEEQHQHPTPPHQRAICMSPPHQELKSILFPYYEFIVVSKCFDGYQKCLSFVCFASTKK